MFSYIFVKSCLYSIFRSSGKNGLENGSNGDETNGKGSNGNGSNGNAENVPNPYYKNSLIYNFTKREFLRDKRVNA